MLRARRAANKVPEVTVYFWITKLLTTAMGEATSDFLAHRFGPLVAAPIGGVAFVVALVIQFRSSRYVAWAYWLAAAMVAVFGTMVADGLHVQIGIPYAVSTTFFAVGLAVIFVVWYLSEPTLSVHSIDTWLREAFYWATVVATFALGTAVGDFTAVTLHLGYFSSAVLFAVAIAVPGVAYRRFHLNAIAAFWAAYVLTRPLGASIADWLAVVPSRGGLGAGDGTVAIALSVLIIGLVAYLTASQSDVAPGRAPSPPGQIRGSR